MHRTVMTMMASTGVWVRSLTFVNLLGLRPSNDHANGTRYAIAALAYSQGGMLQMSATPRSAPISVLPDTIPTKKSAYGAAGTASEPLLEAIRKSSPTVW